MRAGIALLIVDMQHLFLEHQSPQRLEHVCGHINYAAGLLRAGGYTVAHIRDMEDATNVPAEQLETIPAIDVAPGDLRFTKEASNAFWQTNLDDELKSRGIGLVIVAGYAAEHCVLFTYNGAKERGYHTVLLQHGIAGEHEDTIQAMYRDRQVISYPVLHYLSQRSSG